MSNITLELRPPPNVDFVNGFPGIPPSGQERPQATVKGAIEVRVSPPTGIKAKWVRIELRKVEVLPPGGDSNLYWDCIGTPVNLWQATEEYGLLRTQDFPFSIRIPESIPPSVELEGRASIGYELLATVCIKGKRGFLRKAKSTVATSKALITIDKHELHSTWPIYNQPEIRHVSQEGINLMVERNHTCFGPGDRVAVTATVKSDSMHTVILRGFEIVLKETTVLRAGPYGAGRRTQPQVRTISIAENKVMLNATMYGGQQKQAELSCTLNPKHTTPTLNAARHIDVTYTLMVKAVMGTGENLVMDLPVIISNWQRDVSASAIQQIGPTPNLSMLTTTPTASQNPNSQGFYGATHTGNTGRAPVQASTLPVGRTSAERPTHGRQGSGGGVNHYATANPAMSKLPVDEFGYSSTTTTPGRPTVTPINTGANPTARPTSSRSTDNRANRLTITNPHPSDIYSEDHAGGSSSGRPQQRSQVDNAPKQWPSAEEEKRLYEQARSRVETTQGPHAAPAPLSYRTSPPPGGSSSGFGGGSSSAAASSQANGNPDPWMSAEEEKVMLFNKAQAAVLRNQGNTGAEPSAGMGSSSYPNHHRTPSDHATPGGSSSMSNKPSGAQLYQQAMAARKNAPPSQATPIKGAPAFASAEQEKAALRRYQEAREAVDRTQGGLGPEESAPSGAARDSGPIAYEALFPNAGSSSVNRSPPPTANQEPPPPPFAGGAPIGPMAILSEKERLKREYEARDAAALAAQQQQQQPSYAAPPPAFTSAAPPPFTPSAPAPSQYASAIAEKEALRRKFEAQDRAVAAAALPPPAPLQTPSRNSSAKPAPPQPSRGGSYTAPLSPSRPTPSTPGGSSRVLTAAEEKALLKAKFDAQDAAGSRPPAPLQPSRANGRVNGATATPSPPPFSNGAPPPLMPRPPVEYIQETREEDARVARYTMMNGENPATLEDGYGMNGGAKLPPLPPKPAGSD